MSPEKFEKQYKQQILDSVRTNGEIYTIEKFGYIAHLQNVQVANGHRDTFSLVIDIIKRSVHNDKF